MRISIWQQFSSNHSAHFTIIGQFETEEWAEEVAAEMRHILETIGVWWERYETWEERQAIEDKLRQKVQLTPPEEEFRQVYGVEWTDYSPIQGIYPQGVHALDWVKGTRAVGAVQIYRNVVMVSPKGDTWAGSRPFDLIMKALGGSVAVDVEDDDTYLALNLTCNAPDAGIAQVIVDAIVKRPKMYPDRTYAQLPDFENMILAEVEVNQQQIILHHIRIELGGIKAIDAFRLILKYLEERKCTEIQYEFVAAPNEW